MIKIFKHEHRFAKLAPGFKKGAVAFLAALLTIGTFQINAQEVESARQSLPDNVEPSAHEQALFKMLQDKGYTVEPKKVGYDAKLKASEDAKPGEYIYQVTREYYEQFNFKWTDSEGKEHESNLLDRATDPQHILALLKEVYTNPLIPGFRRDMYRGNREEHDEFKIKNNEDGGNGDIIKDDKGNPVLAGNNKQYKTNAETYRSKYETVPYDPCNFGLFRDDKNPMGKVTKPFNGATALLVEMNDKFYSGYLGIDENEKSRAEELFHQYQYHYDHNMLPPDRALQGLNYIQSVRVMPLQFYVDPESSENPGFLFNMNASLSKCFIVTKGVNRPYKAYTHRIQVNSLTEGDQQTLGAGAGQLWNGKEDDPNNKPFEVDAGSVFYNMFEEFSPSNKGPISNAYTKMSTGQIFEVDHNCSSIIGQEHDIIFGSPENHDQIYNVNLMFFLPDRRFDGDTNTQKKDDSVYSCYTFYPEGHRPYFFFNRIYADIDQKIKIASNETVATANGKEVTLTDHALVPVHWKSLYKTIIQQNEEESFEVYRVSQGGMVRTLVPWDQIVIRQFNNEETPQTYVNEDCREGELRRKIGSEVIVYVIEDDANKRSGEQVRYIIQGKRAGSNFEAVESNIVIDYLPNQTNGLTLHHTQSGSLYQERVNYYSNEVQLIHSGYYEGEDLDTEVSGNLKYNDIMVGEFKKEGEAEVLPGFVDSTIELLRYTENNEEPVRVMWCDLRSDDATTKINSWNGDYALVVDLKFTVDESTQQFVPKRDYATDPLIKTVSKMEENTLHLAFNRSIFDEKTGAASFRPLGDYKETLGRFVDNFSQSIENKIPNDYYYMLRIVPNTTPQSTRANVDIKRLESNRVGVQVPSRFYRVGYEGYTKEQIDADNENGYEGRLPENRPGFAFTVSNNPYVAEYEFRCTTHHNPLAKVQRYPGGVYRPFLYEVEGNIRELDRTADNFTGELNILLDHWVDSGDELTLVLHFRDSEENPYTNGNSYGFPIIAMPKAPEITDTYFAAAYWDGNIGKDDTSEKTYVCASRHVTSNLADNEAMSFAGYSFWVKAESSWDDKMDEYLNVFHNTSENPNAHANEHYYNFDFSRYQLTQNLTQSVTIYSQSRMYSEILNPEHVIAPYSPEGYVKPRDLKGQRAASRGTGYYLVTDAKERQAEVTGGNVATEVDGIDSENVETEFYNLQGMKISKDNLTPGIYIRKKGNVTDKIIIK